ncbi:MAG TPA: ribosomal protein S18-alanine N-acetyltransferase [Syntrophorhabdaceae bacterium]|jgi:ribosomal-protein-alanine N-acetyltransferase|nr:ribosomal protein S18-alanine N-acetyltransferase [Syntrophorhabdaceae bacterium]MDI9561525.1 ribosomal protein S18-alanine N-acetyltransferase [Pseudomonadota bacterium]MBV6506637.1 Ribosomal-protein-alanine acetyltransferase [Syntrophorhabdaceae bacterium]HNQ63016.1 ribosomal protein S18-alanine N-acetyltransferase [Syntrophorhabdaceae bacterium]HNZ58588.1 ribosomal protein S18-alanine N-acetyltransferase [Syntrophorhabdaceae bacterium]
MIREMMENDLDKVLETERLSFISPWTKNMFRETYLSPITANFVININESIVGYIMLYSVEDEAHIMNLAIHPDYRRKGYGSNLVAHIIEYSTARDIYNFFLEVREGNVDAQRLYKRFGFEVIGKRKGYYMETKEDALVMHLSKGK